MSSHKAVYTKEAPEPVGPYSQATVLGNMVFASGQIAINPKDNSLVTDSIEAETRQVLNNLQSVLHEAGTSLSKTVKITIFLSDMGHFAVVNKVYESFLQAPYPARACVAVKTLPKNVNVEMDAIAYI